jgi:predicted ArsR family transcriptional regulator
MKKPHWTEQLHDELVRDRADNVPAGWLTVVGMADEAGISKHTMKARLEALEKTGRIEKKVFRIYSGKTVRPVAHFKRK